MIRQRPYISSQPLCRFWQFSQCCTWKVNPNRMKTCDEKLEIGRTFAAYVKFAV